VKTFEPAAEADGAERIDSRFVIVPAVRDDAERILYLQRLAYLVEAERYQEWQIPPLTESVRQMLVEFGRQLFLKACVHSARQIVGAVRARLENGTCHVGRLIVHPDFQGHGIGSTLLRAIEERFASATRFELFTGHCSADNLRFYACRGYAPFREQPVSTRLTLVYLEKVRD
jgi:GNAT superfamily N-acetyltransferase